MTTRRQQKRERVRLALAARRFERRQICEARWARHDQAVYRYYGRLASACRCCHECCPGPCDTVMAGGVCEMVCFCAEWRRELDEREPEFDDWRDDDDYGLDRDGWRP